ncbi:MAG: M20/M25/M40 family metallo-hydrolase [Verrucomicrobia bacterium]|nr:M20/M25/M40 family metallo-hydrolase [Verrucomicrobiota bacterium]
MKLTHFPIAANICFLLSLCATANAAETNLNNEGSFLSNTRQLIYEGRRSGEGYFSPDGKALIFQSEREADNPFYQIYILDLATGESHRVSPGVGKTTCGFFRPRSDEVLFASTHLDPQAKAKQKTELDFRASGKERRYSWDYDEQMDIFSAHRDGSHLRRLTDAFGYDAEASYSPDGKKIVFTSLRDAYPTNKLSAAERKHLETDPSYFGEIYIMKADGSNQRRLTHTPGYDGGPFFSPDGKRIIWRRFNETGTIADVYTMKLDGSDERRLTDFGCMSWAPYFHPSGKYVIFTANKLGFSNFELFLVDAAGKHEPVRVTFTDGFDGLPVFSPDGKQLCWTSGRTPDGKSQLFLAYWNHEHALASLGAAPMRSSPTKLQTASQTPTVTRAESKATKLSPDITVPDLRAEVGYLASDALEGRMTGTRGSQLAAEFIAETLRQSGLKPFGDNNTFFQSFSFNSGVRIVTNENTFAVVQASVPSTPKTFVIEKDFRPLSFTDNGEVEAEVVFAGYGLSVPGKAGEGYNSYTGLDVTNKIVMVLRYVPEGVEPKRRQELNRYAALRYKAMIAREHGAKAVLVVTGHTSPNAGALAPLSFDSSLAGSGIVGASIGTNVADAILAGSGKELKSLQSALDTENPHAEGGFLVPGVKVKVAASVEHLKKTDRNVIAVLPPAKGVTDYILVGAHYDHLGRGESGSLERKEEEGQIHNGADDNASGVAAVLELSAALAAERKQKPENFGRGVILALWSGEEMGLVGSSYFAEHPEVALSNIVACLNFDMVGRLRENKLVVQGAGSSSVWRRLLEKRNVAAGFNLIVQEDPYLPTDVTAFYPKHVPVLNCFTGSHENYHRPTDRADTLNYAGLERITRFAEGIISDLAKESARPDYLSVQRAESAGGGRDNLRVYLGTIPDYTAEVAGVKLSGVRGGSPADKGGLKGGDVIVEFAGQKIANIYDYTYALDAAKIGQPLNIVVLRDGKRVTLNVIPEARK